jgi:hypothetical protein
VESTAQYSDSFNRANAATLGAPWNPLVPGNWAVAGNSATHNAITIQDANYYDVVISADHYSRIVYSDVVGAATGQIGCGVRLNYSGGEAYGYVAYIDATGITVQSINGSIIGVGLARFASAVVKNGDTLELAASGTSIYAMLNGVTVITFDDAVLQGLRPLLRIGKPGLTASITPGFNVAVPTGVIDSWAGGEKVTDSVINAANFANDYGVVGGLTGKQFQKVTGVPLRGQYAVSAAGLYTFSPAEQESPVLISYTWNDTSKGTTISLSNQLMGFAPYCQMLLYNNFRNVYFAVELYSCVLGKIMLPTKQEDFWIMDIEWTCNTNSADQLGKLYAEQ